MTRIAAWSRRTWFKSGIGSIVASLLAGRTASAVAAPAVEKGSVYERLGVRPVINAVGTLTTLGGTLMPPEVKQAMEAASRHFVLIHELQAAAGRRLAELTGAEAAFVTPTLKK
jgi:L-seryl-tRNA(Ser) seleniumtransferase